MDLGSVVAQAAEVLSKPNQGFWKSQVQSPAKDDFQDSFVLPFVIGCGILICLPYLRHGQALSTAASLPSLIAIGAITLMARQLSS